MADPNGSDKGSLSSSLGLDLAPGDRDRLIERFGRRLVAGEVIFSDGDPARQAFLLQEGRVRLLKRVRGIERSLVVLKPGEFFGETALLGGDAPGEESLRTSVAVALTPGLVLALDRTTFRAIVQHHPQVAMRVLEQLVRRVRDAEDQIELMLLGDGQLKVVSAILKLARRTSGAVEIALSPVELSSRVGLDVDTVKRNVQRLREQQYLRIVGEKVEIPDVEALRRLSVLLSTKEDLAGEGPAGA